jgi:hypothetical protein
MMRRAAAILAMALVLPAAAGAQGSHTAERLRARIAREARAAGLDPSWVMSHPLTLRVLHADGRESRTTVTVEQVIERIALRATLAAPVAGPAEVTAGDLIHLYANACFPCASAELYTITTSAVVPATPPVLLPPPATPLFFDAGGPLTQVKGGGWIIGTHTAGTVVGSNVDTGTGAPAPWPVWLPVVTTGVLADTSIDFIGHAAVAQGEFCAFSFCLAAGALVGDGLALFDDTSGASIPTIP